MAKECRKVLQVAHFVRPALVPAFEQATRPHDAPPLSQSSHSYSGFLAERPIAGAIPLGRADAGKTVVTLMKRPPLPCFLQRTSPSVSPSSIFP
jgi:hypothetical protein